MLSFSQSAAAVYNPFSILQPFGYQTLFLDTCK